MRGLARNFATVLFCFQRYIKKKVHFSEKFLWQFSSMGGSEVHQKKVHFLKSFSGSFLLWGAQRYIKEKVHFSEKFLWQFSSMGGSEVHHKIPKMG